MQRFLNSMKGYAATQAGAIGQPRFATVTSVNPNDHTAKVLIQPDGTMSGWLPILSQWIGSGWGMVSLPSPGDQVFVLAQDGDAEHGVIVGRAFSDAARPPAAPSGELWMVHQSGAFIKLTNNGQVSMQDAAGASISLTNSGTVAVNGVLAVTGAIKVNGITVNVP